MTEPATSKRIYRVAGAAAIAVVLIAGIQAPILVLYPQPTTVMGHFTQFQTNRLLGLVDLDLMLILAQAATIPVLIGVYAALRRASQTAMAIALGLGLGGVVLYFAVNPTFSMLYLSDQYAAATTDAQRAALLAAGVAIWANYNGTAFGLFFVFTGAADLIIAAVMLRSGIFGRTTAYVGLVVGAMLLVPPLPVLGTLPLVLSYVVILPSVLWEVLLARRFFQLARSSEEPSERRPVPPQLVRRAPAYRPP